jgi:hypothetical protein
MAKRTAYQKGGEFSEEATKSVVRKPRRLSKGDAAGKGEEGSETQALMFGDGNRQAIIKFNFRN